MAAGSGFTAAADASISRTIVGVTSGAYSTPSTNGMYAGCFNTQFTAAAKAGATEWTTASDGSYARQQMGVSTAFGWSIAAYVNSTGVVWNNSNTITFPAVTLNNQSLAALGWIDVVTLGSGNINFFYDLSAALSVNIGSNVILNPSTGAVFTTY